MRHQVEINVQPYGAIESGDSVKIDGVGIGALVTGADIKVTAADTLVTLHLANQYIAFTHHAASFELAIKTRELLIRLGWTPPAPDLPPATTCTCAKVETTPKNSSDREFIRGRRDPDCPEHGDVLPACTVVGTVAGYVRRCGLRAHGVDVWHRDGVFEWTAGDGNYIVRIDGQQR